MCRDVTDVFPRMTTRMHASVHARRVHASECIRICASASLAFSFAFVLRIG